MSLTAELSTQGERQRWTNKHYTLPGLDSIQIAGLRMSSHSKRVEIKDILNPLTVKSSESSNSQKPVDEGLHSKISKTEKLVISHLVTLSDTDLTFLYMW